MTLAEIARTVGYLATLGGLAAFFAKLWRKLRDMAGGQTCLLRSSITAIYYRHADEPEPCLREYERKNLDDLYAGYKALGGNHFVDDLYQVMRDWHVQT